MKQSLRALRVTVPSGQSSHRDLLLIVRERRIISENLYLDLSLYLAFRHFFVHGYSLDLVPERMSPLAAKVTEVFKAFRANVTIRVWKKTLSESYAALTRSLQMISLPALRPVALPWSGRLPKNLFR